MKLNPDTKTRKENMRYDFTIDCGHGPECTTITLEAPNLKIAYGLIRSEFGENVEIIECNGMAMSELEEMSNIPVKNRVTLVAAGPIKEPKVGEYPAANEPKKPSSPVGTGVRLAKNWD